MSSKQIYRTATRLWGPRWEAVDAEVLVSVVVLSAVLIVGLATVGDYGITNDEFNADDYGRKAFAWYASGFTDRSSFESVEDTLWYYGPWFHIFIAWVQSFGLANPWTVRHAMTFLAGLAGIAALVPLGRLAVGRWAGLIAVGLCLTTGYLYGSLFFTPIDVPFLLAMTLAMLAIVIMARRVVPSWPATAAAGLLTGLAIATRSSGLITQVYLLAALGLCALEAVVASGGSIGGDLLRIAVRGLCALALGWLAAFVLWPWLQIGNPFLHFKLAFELFANHPNSFEMPVWGMTVVTTALPWWYVPGELLARLPEGFMLLLMVGIVSALAAAAEFVGAALAALATRRMGRVRAAVLLLARSRQQLLVWAAVILPLGFIIVRHSTLYDGIRHVLFVIPMLAVIAAAGLLRLRPGRFPLVAAAVGGIYLGVSIWTLAVLHPLEYVAANALAGGVAGAQGRFDLDYFAVAATVALRRLENRLDYDRPARFAENPPTIAICMSYRERLVAPLFRRPWRLEPDPKQAEFIIATERWPCAQDIPDAVLIDEVRRFDRPFAWVYVRAHPHAARSAPAAVTH